MTGVRTGLVGYGFHGQTIHQAAKESGLDIIAVLEPNEELHEKIRAMHAEPYIDLEAFSCATGLEAVIVASPVSTHRTIVARAIEMGLAVELEKPMALTYAESQQIAALAEVANVRMMVGMTTQYRPEMVFVREQIARGVIGEIKTIHEEIVIGVKPFPMNYVAEENGGGVLLENGIHMLDHLLWFGGSIATMLSSSIGSPFLGGYHDDTAIFHLRHTNGVVSMGHLQWMPYKEANGFCLKIYGTRGMLEVRGLDRVIVNIDGEISTHPFYGDGNYLDNFGERHLPGVVAQLQDFAAYVRDGREPQITVAHVLEAHRWLDEAYRLAKS